jgi:hypothetical protein
MNQADTAGGTALRLPKASLSLPLVSAMLGLGHLGAPSQAIAACEQASIVIAGGTARQMDEGFTLRLSVGFLTFGVVTPI